MKSATLTGNMNNKMMTTHTDRDQGTEEHTDMKIHNQTIHKNTYDITITESDITEQLRKTKNKNAPGPNGIKVDLYKILIVCDIAIHNLAQCLNKVLNSEYTQAGWQQ